MKQKIKVKVSEISDKPNRFLVYDELTMKPLSGIKGQSRSVAYKIAKKFR